MTWIIEYMTAAGIGPVTVVENLRRKILNRVDRTFVDKCTVSICTSNLGCVGDAVEKRLLLLLAMPPFTVETETPKAVFSRQMLA